MEEKLRKKIQEVKDLMASGKVSPYQIEMDTYRSLKQASLRSLRDGKADIDHLQFRTIEILSQWHDRHYHKYVDDHD
ncbi:hypothetical protein FAJ35_02670 [Streptococcus suis]|uniref:DNA-binding protein n=1 Tax=Streptococcus suis TaxID=1307 RepID=A0A4T2GV63_STRSU|nr:hypothetical protein [Streptococcus suis]TII03203.1 hypothetical protein FAJ35_02670 [Streptococcus suis]